MKEARWSWSSYHHDMIETLVMETLIIEILLTLVHRARQSIASGTAVHVEKS